MREPTSARPWGGVVMGLNVHTDTGVIAPGQHLLDIVPEDDTVVIEAQVTPTISMWPTPDCRLRSG